MGFGVSNALHASAAPALAGDFNEWKNGSIVFAAAEAIVAAGSDGRITNNTIHDVSYMAVGNGGVTTDSSTFPPARNEISGNTVSRTGRMGISLYGDPAVRVLRNRVSQAMLIIDGGGLIYSPYTKGTGAEIAYNDVSDIACIYGTGIYLDDGASGFVVHPNLVRNVSWYGVSLKMPSQFFNSFLGGNRSL